MVCLRAVECESEYVEYSGFLAESQFPSVVDVLVKAEYSVSVGFRGLGHLAVEDVVDGRRHFTDVSFAV